MKTIPQDTQDFLEAILWAYPENDEGQNEMDGKSVYDFSPAFIAGATQFLDECGREVINGFSIHFILAFIVFWVCP